jgi:hypothetical protein
MLPHGSVCRLPGTSAPLRALLLESLVPQILFTLPDKSQLTIIHQDEKKKISAYNFFDEQLIVYDKGIDLLRASTGQFSCPSSVVLLELSIVVAQAVSDDAAFDENNLTKRGEQ